MPWTIPNLLLNDKPVPPANMRSHGRNRVFVCCSNPDCHHKAEIDASGFPGDMTFGDLQPRMLCTMCNHQHHGCDDMSEATTMWKGIAIGVGLVVESALCASAQTPDQSEETKRTLTQKFLDCVASQVITIDDLTSNVAGIARGAVSLCRAEAHAAAVSKAGSQNELVPNVRTGLEASGIETGIAALIKSRAAMRKQPVPRVAGFAEAEAESEANLDLALTSHRPKKHIGVSQEP